MPMFILTSDLHFADKTFVSVISNDCVSWHRKLWSDCLGMYRRISVSADEIFSEDAYFHGTSCKKHNILIS